MSQKSRNKDWSELMVAMDRISRVYGEFILPVLARHEAETLSLANVLFLISIGDGETKVNDIVRRGRYVGSNASYALKALETAGFISRRKDEADRRNALVSWTKRGRALISDIRTNSIDGSGHCRSTWDAMAALENHCARLPSES